MLDGSDATPERLLATIRDLLADGSSRAAMSAASAKHGRPDAADKVVAEILSAAAQR
jgi:UDP-N-acetylglucosamine--N-acetylmuramyl-(pentapeptide) pyrophosphoryl-undecaprenol N-acetylglucosamine transferase